MGASPNWLVYYQGIYPDDVLILWGAWVLRPCHPFTPNTLSTRPHRIETYSFPPATLAAGSKTIGLNEFAERTLLLVPPNFRLKASGVKAADAPPIASRNPETDGIPLLSHTTNILQIHRETTMQPHECPERGNVALRSGLYKMTSWAPRGPLHSRHQMERSAVS